MKKHLAPVRLERLLEILSEDIATAADEEILTACRELGLKPEMKGSIALLGVKNLFFPYRYWVFPEEVRSPAARGDDEAPDTFPRQ